jgi:putative membrane protein
VKKRVRWAASGAAAVLLLVTAAFAADKPAGPDRQFVMEAARGGMAEVKLGELATKKAASDDVKQFGQHMVQDHSKANAELKQLADKKGWTLPADVGPKHKAVMDRLSGLSGSAFDRAYMTEMVRDHEKTVALFERETKNGKDEDLRSWAEKTLPTLRHHLTMARETAGKVGAGKGAAKASR